MSTSRGRRSELKNLGFVLVRCQNRDATQSRIKRLLGELTISLVQSRHVMRTGDTSKNFINGLHLYFFVSELFKHELLHADCCCLHGCHQQRDYHAWLRGCHGKVESNTLDEVFNANNPKYWELRLVDYTCPLPPWCLLNILFIHSEDLGNR